MWLSTREAASATPIRPPVYSLADYGCQQALDGIRQNSGGTFYVPPGVWACPSLNFTSHTTIYLAENATLMATPSEDEWPLLAPLSIYGDGHDHPGPRYAPFIGGWDVEDLVIGGMNGTINGSGQFWWAIFDAHRERYTRPSLFECVRCTDVVMQDVTFANSGFWTVHPVLNKRVTARRITIRNPHPSPNTDGFDPDATSDVLLEDSFIWTDDDAVAIKAGWDCAVGPEPVASNNITIRNVTVWKGGGGMSIGSEMSGGVSNVLIENVRMSHGSYGVQIKTGASRGGFVRDIVFRDLTIVNATKNAIRIDGFYGFANPTCGTPPPHNPPHVNNITLDNVTTRLSNRSLHLHGLDDVPTTEVSLRHVTLAEGIFECYGGVSGSAVDVKPKPPPTCGLATL